MHLEIEIQVDDYRDLLRLIHREVTAPQKLLGSFGETLFNRNRERHRMNLDPDGNPWAPLSPLTIGTAAYKKESKGKSDRWRKKRAMSIKVANEVKAKKSGRMLYERGDVMKSFNYRVTGDTLTIGFGNEKAKWLHYGTGIHGPKGVPYTIKPVNKKALAFAGIVVKRVTHPGMPARKLVGFPDSDKAAVRSTANSYFSNLLKRGR